MANRTRKPNSSNYVDINSNTQVIKVHNKKWKVIRIISAVLSVIMIICGWGLVGVYGYLDSMHENVSEDDYAIVQPATNNQGEELDSNTVVADSELFSDSNILNVMLFGEDYSGGASHGRSDTMILLTINNYSKTIKLTSFQRDTYVYIPSKSYPRFAKLNAAYAEDGPALAIRTIEANFGIDVDRYVRVDFKSFQKIVDILGGVKIFITADEAGYINWQMYINNQAPDRNTLEEVDGVVKLNGQQALWYARNRGFYEEGYSVTYKGDDWDRTERQRKFINAIFNEMKKASLSEIVDITTTIGPLVKTNFSADEITTLLPGALTYVGYEFQSTSIPQAGYWKYGYNEAGSVIEITDIESCRSDLKEFVSDKKFD